MTEILLYGVIGEPMDGLDAKTIVTAVRAASGPLSVRINSPGGFVTEGFAIIAALRAYSGRITIYIDGLAASMASVIAMVGAETIMAESAVMMIHKPSSACFGTADDLRHGAGQLDLLEEQTLTIYAQRTGLPTDELARMLAAETWFDAEEALAAGFVTSIAQPLRIAAMAKATGYGFRHLPDRLKENPVPDAPDAAQAVANERTRVTQIMALSAKHRVPQELTERLISGATPLATAREHILDFLADQSDRQQIGNLHSQHQTLDNPQVYGDAIQGAILAKIAGRAAEGPAAEFRAMSVVDIARDYLVRGGDRGATRLSPDRVIAAAMAPTTRGARNTGYLAGAIGGLHTTSDFPDLIGGASEKYLIERYKMQESQLKLIASQRPLSNFLTHYGVQTSGIGRLDKVNEAGEYRNKTLTTRKEGYALQTYGNIIGVSRQLLINDALGALASIIQVMAAAATEMEAQILADLINNNPIMSDGKPWFDAAHGNLSNLPAPPAFGSLDAGRQAMRSQKDGDNTGLIDAKPKFLVVPVTLETGAEVLIASTMAATTTQFSAGGDTTVQTAANANPFQGKLVPIADPRITDPKAWYLFADPAFAPAMQYSYLDGHEAPFLDQNDGWRTDGTEYKVRHDFGAGILDYRLAWRNPGI